MEIDGKIAFVTGGASGIGLAVARLLAENGVRTCLADIDYERAESVSKTIPLSSPWKLDVSDSRNVRDVFARTAMAEGPADILVTCAGIPGHGSLPELSDESWHRIIAVNLDGVFFCMREALAQMLPKKSGVIVTVSSICGMTGCPSSPAYSAAKAGVIGFTKACARRYAPDGIRCNTVAPGLTDTPFVEPDRKMGKLQKGIEKIPLGRMGTPEEIAETIVFLCGKGASFVTGQVISPNGGQVI